MNQIGALDSEFIYEMPSTTRAAEAGSLDWFLVEHYLLFSANPGGTIFKGRVHHAPYQIAAATCERLSTDPVLITPPSSILTAAPVEVKIYPLRRS